MPRLNFELLENSCQCSVELGQSVCNHYAAPTHGPYQAIRETGGWVGSYEGTTLNEVCFSAVFTCVCTRLHHYQPLAASSHN